METKTINYMDMSQLSLLGTGPDLCPQASRDTTEVQALALR